MTHTSLLVRDDFEYFRVLVQVDSLSDSSINLSFTHVAQEVADLLQHTYPTQAGDSNHAGVKTIRAIELEYRQILTVQPLTES